MRNSIDWSGLLECKIGDVCLTHKDTADHLINIQLYGVCFDVYKSSGVPDKNAVVREDNCTVRNKKTNRDKAIEIANKHNDHFSELLFTFTDALIEAGLLKED